MSIFGNSRLGIDWARVARERGMRDQQQVDAATMTANATKTNADTARMLVPSQIGQSRASAALTNAQARELPLEGASVRAYRAEQTRGLGLTNEVRERRPMPFEVQSLLDAYGYTFSDAMDRQQGPSGTTSLYNPYLDTALNIRGLR